MRNFYPCTHVYALTRTGQSGRTLQDIIIFGNSVLNVSTNIRNKLDVTCDSVSKNYINVNLRPGATLTIIFR